MHQLNSVRALVRCTLLTAVIVCSGLTSTALANPPSGQQTAVGQTHDKDILGGWSVVWNIGGITYPTLLLFDAGGGVSSVGQFGSPFFGTGIGNWKEIAPGQYAVTYTGFVSAADGSNPALGTFKSRLIIQLGDTRDTFTAQAQAVGWTCGIGVATRIAIEAPECK